MPDASQQSGLILASSSPRRRELLGRLELPFTVVSSGVLEREPEAGEDPAAYALSLAREKAADVAAGHPREIVLGADTVVTVGGRILNKPRDAEDAMAMLRQLRGRTHLVITAIAVGCGGREAEGSVTAEVLMRAWSDAELRRYVSSAEPMDKAGAYAVQGLGGELVERVDGCYNTVVGLPLCLTVALLGECGLHVPVPDREIDPHYGAGELLPAAD